MSSLLVHHHQKNISSKIALDCRSICIGSFFGILNLQHELLCFECAGHYLINQHSFPATVWPVKTIVKCYHLFVKQYLHSPFLMVRSNIPFCMDAVSKLGFFVWLVGFFWFWFCCFFFFSWNCTELNKLWFCGITL